MNLLYQYLQVVRPLLNVMAVERAAGIPRMTLRHHYYWADGKKGRPLPPEKWGPVLHALCAHFGTVMLGDTYFFPGEEGAVIAHRTVSDDDIDDGDYSRIYMIEVITYDVLPEVIRELIFNYLCFA